MRRDVSLLFSTRIIRLFCYGFLSVVLALYLAETGFNETQIGLLFTLTLVGDAIITLWLTTSADRFGRKKTLVIGAILGAAPPDEENAAADYGMHLGTAFQLIDDVLDYSGEQAVIGKNLGDDLAEGKPTLPLIYTIREGTAEQARLVRHAIEHGGRGELAAVIEAIRSTGALDYAREQARRESRAAGEALARLPHSRSREYLLELASFAVTRSY